ncbi:MAG: hypothetical protein U5N85_17670 [Arcicella sp.]|nr:hypothetical protein [Arcicella sp.]
MQIIINNLLLADTDQEIEIAMKAMREEMDKANPEQKVILKSIISAKIKMMSKDAERLIAEANNIITTPEFTIDLNEWITMKEYTKRFQLASTNVVSNWIKRGVVPPANIKTLPMLNNLKLIKAVKYL